MKDFIIPDRDFGTPAAKSKQMVTLTIDGFDVTVPEGTSIMRAAAEALAREAGRGEVASRIAALRGAAKAGGSEVGSQIGSKAQESSGQPRKANP